MKTATFLITSLLIAACHEGPPTDVPHEGADAEAPKQETTDAHVAATAAAGETCNTEVGCAAGLQCVIAPCAVAPCTNGTCQKM